MQIEYFSGWSFYSPLIEDKRNGKLIKVFLGILIHVEKTSDRYPCIWVEFLTHDF